MEDLLLVYIAYAIAAGSPGPSTMAIMNTAMAQGRGAALALAGGVITMSITWGLIAATGLSTVLSRYAEALVVLKILGGLYLLWLAIKSARSTLHSHDPSVAKETDGTKLSTLYRRGVLMHVGNPKSVLSWLAIMTLGVGSSASPERVAVAFLGCVLLGMIIFTGYALIFSTQPMVRAYARVRRWIEGTLAVVFAAAGFKLIIAR